MKYIVVDMASPMGKFAVCKTGRDGKTKVVDYTYTEDEAMDIASTLNQYDDEVECYIYEDAYA